MAAAATCLLSEDQFLCSICLDVFTDPVSTPCGHNFCKTCITEHWRVNTPCRCPLCKEVFQTKPKSKINSFISEMVTQFRQEANSSSSEQQAAKPGEVPCDICTESKLKALKSCLVCLTSYCDTHLKPHLTKAPLKRHQLIDAVENLENRMCEKHDKPLKLFCKTDQTCVCMLCPILDHKRHDIVHLKEEHQGQNLELKKTDAEIQQKIQERQLKIQEIKHVVDLSKKAADRETAEGVQVFTAVMESVQRSLNQLKEEIEEKQRRTEKQGEDFIKELEQEISELKKRSTEVEQLSHSEDHLHFVQRFSSVKSAPAMKSWEKVSVCPPSYEGTAVRIVSQLEVKLSKEIQKLYHSELKRVQQYAVDVTLDPDTAHPTLILSDDNKQVHHSNLWKSLPNNPERFSNVICVLGKQSFSSGKFYFEVQVRDKTGWVVGVAGESIIRKGPTFLSPQYGNWTICLRNGNVFGPSAFSLSLKSQPQKVGVFVDYAEGLVSFYDVDTADQIYILKGCCFTEKLLPYLGPSLNDGGKNAAPLIITPVGSTE
ncbi:E3 ubiquitin-protein ligase TRIM39-like [Sphaeramia orbicularis]|nr:E3 ubiquitin-protein ligase TRIM39-like [Sphaeramia orbicularis]